jgi:DNA-binding beta-propeller fold protein YncE
MAPDAIAFDPASGKVLCMNHRGGTVTLISISADGKQFTPEELQVGGALEFVVCDGDGHAFVNVEDKNQVVEFDTRSPKVLNRWTTGDGDSPTGLALGREGSPAFRGCGGNNKLVVIDSSSGTGAGFTAHRPALRRLRHSTRAPATPSPLRRRNDRRGASERRRRKV